jgi:SPP1 family predicted phage head-tail adaptor
MKLNDYIIIYERASVSDGAGGMTPGALTEKYRCYANVKPMGGMLGMTFQQQTGSQGYTVYIRTDFDREIDREYLITYQGIYGDINMVIQDVAPDRQYTKLTCKRESTI